MMSQFKIQSIIKSLPLWIAIWLAFAIYYAHSYSTGYHIQEADYVAYAAQMIADVALGLFSFLAYWRVNDKVYKRFLLFVFISIVVGLLSTEVYNILVNIIHVKNINASVNALWIYPYTAFLIIEILSWQYLLYAKRSKTHLANKSRVSQWPYIVSASLIFSSVFFTGMFKSMISKELGIAQTLNLTFETILFVQMAICLSRSKNKSLSYLATGVLFLIALNMAHRFSYLLGHYYKTFDIVWLISYIVVIYGFVLSIQHKDEKIELFEQNSIHVIASAIFIIFATFVSILFIALEFFLSSIETNQIVNMNLLQENIPSILVFIFFLSILVSKLVATYFSKPLENISKRIDLIQTKKLNSDGLPEEKFRIGEIKKLDGFIMQTIGKLQAANRVKSEFVMNMSHDFRTPASGIHSMSKLIHRKLNDNGLKQLQRLVVDSSKQLLNLLDDVLDYSRLDNDVVKTTHSEIEINSLINEVVSFMSSKAKEKNLAINAKLPESTIDYYGDQLLLKRILINLVSNAIKFTHKGGVDISTYVAQNENNKRIIIQVADTGIGIDKQYHDSVFEPFCRVESAETSMYSGVGLGLSNVNLMLKKLGGEIFLDSALGKGTTFTIILPIQ